MLAALHTLTDPWADPVVRRALLEVALLGVTGGALGCWIVFYGLSYSAESLAHALLPGLVVAALTGIPLLLGGAAGLLVAALAIAAAGQVPAIGRDTAVAVVVTTLFGAGVLLALSPASPPGLQSLLFGDVLGVSDGDLALAAGLAVLVLGALALLHRGCSPSASTASARRASACARSSSTSRCSCSWRSPCSSPCRASATCWWSRCSSRRRRPRAWWRGGWRR